LSGDQGARKLLTGAGVVELPVDDHSIALDIDTPQALAQWQSSLKRERA
jgi:CTP:molybdopterin cytidylyltransferase MocA